jgi:hypothetical protein
MTMRTALFLGQAFGQATLALVLLGGCSGGSSGGAPGADGGGTSVCPNPVAASEGDAGGGCATCLESGCFSQLGAYLAATTATCSAASAALSTCASTACGPACAGSDGTATIDSGTTFSPTCQTYVACCIAANSVALLDAGITLASIELSCDQNASVSTDAECATDTAEFLDAGVVCN